MSSTSKVPASREIGRGGRARWGPTKTMCQEGLEVAQLIVNAVGALIST
jgi:hypothetical protein